LLRWFVNRKNRTSSESRRGRIPFAGQKPARGCGSVLSAKPFSMPEHVSDLATSTANLCPIEFDAAKSDSRPRMTILHNNAGGCKTSVEPNDNQLWRPSGLDLGGLSCKTIRTKRKIGASLIGRWAFQPMDNLYKDWPD
jgi:hypothetical protein